MGFLIDIPHFYNSTPYESLPPLLLLVYRTYCFLAVVDLSVCLIRLVLSVRNNEWKFILACPHLITFSISSIWLLSFYR